MKKTLHALTALAAAFALTLTACQAQPAAAVDTVQPAPSSQAAESAPGPAQEEGSHILIAYFSVPETDGVDTVSGASRVVVEGDVLGNNQYIAQLIHQETGGDLFRIETVQAYPGTHSELLAFGHDEQAAGSRPQLAAEPENLDSYDVVFLGYPIWNADLPMPLYTFLESYDLSGKTIVPFTVHGGSRFAGTIQTIQQLQPGAAVWEDGLSISRSSVLDAPAAVTEWVGGLEL